jgi:hypothetical protein
VSILPLWTCLWVCTNQPCSQRPQHMLQFELVLDHQSCIGHGSGLGNTAGLLCITHTSMSNTPESLYQSIARQRKLTQRPCAAAS